MKNKKLLYFLIAMVTISLTILGIILRDENIGATVMPFVNNIIIYKCDYPDTVEQVMDCSFEEFVNTIKNLDFSNYSVGVIKNKE